MGEITQFSARERIIKLLDENSFVEIGAMVHARTTDFNREAEKIPSDGVITGYGTIEGKLAYVYSQDIQVMQGSVGEMHAGKLIRIYEMALKMGAPVIGMIDCAGLRLQEAADGLNGLGKLYQKQTMASGVIPQICGIFGKCGGGMALVAGLADFTFGKRDGIEFFVNGPDTLEGHSKETLDTSSAVYQSQVTGMLDGVGADDLEVLEQIRNLVAMLPSNNKEDGFYMTETKDDLNRENGTLDETSDVRLVLKDISDDYRFTEVKKDYARDMIIGFIGLNGHTVGAVANDGGGFMTGDGMEKAARFLRFCDAFSIPVLTMIHIQGFKATLEEEKSIGHRAVQLISAYGEATVPKVAVIIGKAYGSASLCMGSMAVGADMVYAWPKAQMGMMNGSSAAKIIYADEIAVAEDKKALIIEKTAAYEELQNSLEAAASRGYIDCIIEPAATRKRVIAAFEMLMTKREKGPDRKHGTV